MNMFTKAWNKVTGKKKSPVKRNKHTAIEMEVLEPTEILIPTQAAQANNELSRPPVLTPRQQLMLPPKEMLAYTYSIMQYAALWRGDDRRRNIATLHKEYHPLFSVGGMREVAEMIYERKAKKITLARANDYHRQGMIAIQKNPALLDIATKNVEGFLNWRRKNGDKKIFTNLYTKVIEYGELTGIHISREIVELVMKSQPEKKPQPIAAIPVARRELSISDYFSLPELLAKMINADTLTIAGVFADTLPENMRRAGISGAYYRKDRLKEIKEKIIELWLYPTKEEQNNANT